MSTKHGVKRDELMIAADRAKVCNLLAMGYKSRTEIAAIINEGRSSSQQISPTQISHDIEYMKNEYLKRGFEDLSVYRHQFLDELDLLKRTYWQGYELSRRNKISIESEAVVDDEEDYDIKRSEGVGLQDGEKVFARLAKIREEQRLEGNPAFLQGVQACIDRQSKILGIDAPNKIAITDATGTKDAVDIVDYMRQKMEELATKHQQKQLPAEVIDVTPNE